MKNGISAQKALEYCKKMNYEITLPGLIFLGKQYDFMEKINSHWKVDLQKLIQYIKKANKPIPENYISVSEFAKETNKSIFRIYQLIRQKKLSCIKIGKGKGITYVKREDVERINEKYKRNNNENKTGKES